MKLPDKQADETFETVGVQWRCWIIDRDSKAPGAASFEWRTPKGRGRAARNVGKPTFWGKLDGYFIGEDFTSLSEALHAVAFAADYLAREAREVRAA